MITIKNEITINCLKKFIKFMKLKHDTFSTLTSRKKLYISSFPGEIYIKNIKLLKY